MAHSEEIQRQELGCDVITAHRGDPGQSVMEGPGVVSVGNFSGGLYSVWSSVSYVESGGGLLQPYSYPWSHQTGMTTSYFRSLTVLTLLGTRAHAIRSTIRQKKALLLRSSKEAVSAPEGEAAKPKGWCTSFLLTVPLPTPPISRLCERQPKCLRPPKPSSAVKLLASRSWSFQLPGVRQKLLSFMDHSV